jgi:hypothetical protein
MMTVSGLSRFDDDRLGPFALGPDRTESVLA